MLRYPPFKRWLPMALASGVISGQPVPKPKATAPHFTIRESIQAEWQRAAPNLEIGALPRVDRERYELTLRRIGAPGMPKLLPPELENPTVEIWEAKAKEARTPRERFTALHFLNRLKSTKALTALDGLKPEDAMTWPKHLYLDANIATARLQGGEVSEILGRFLNALGKAGKASPVRTQAARLRLVMSGKENELLPLVEATPGATLAMLDAWNRGSLASRQASHSKLFQVWTGNLDAPAKGLEQPEFSAAWRALGLLPLRPQNLLRCTEGLTQRLLEGLPEPLPPSLAPGAFLCLSIANPRILPLAAKKLGSATDPPIREEVRQALAFKSDTKLPGLLHGAGLAALRASGSESANAIREQLLRGSDPIARSAAIEDLPEAPADLDTLTQLAWKDRDLEPQQTLIESYSRWKLANEKQIELLKPWLQHPDWACRYLAYQQLVKLDPTTPWPTTSEPNERERILLKEAARLASSGRPLRLRITFSGKRRVTLRLDPTVAPINVANLATLARKGFFNGRLVPRVVPDFVVQMGSPYDTMDGGPGYSVRCENSLDWYGPGSVGMALSGKDTGGSQFFITTNATPHLTGKYTRMGEVEDPDRALKILDDLELGAKIERLEVLE
ncbi:MAG: peptidylprolyl isomerase [Holophagaceae bacterium]|nr:peptidylprolyl isomerase [Holophagaceae bacterium]